MKAEEQKPLSHEHRQPARVESSRGDGLMVSPRGPSRAGIGGGGGGGSSSPIVVPVRDGVQRFTPRINLS
jgi:hypothetical protein